MLKLKLSLFVMSALWAGNRGPHNGAGEVHWPVQSKKLPMGVIYTVPPQRAEGNKNERIDRVACNDKLEVVSIGMFGGVQKITKKGDQPQSVIERKGEGNLWIDKSLAADGSGYAINTTAEEYKRTDKRGKHVVIGGKSYFYELDSFDVDGNVAKDTFAVTGQELWPLPVGLLGRTTVSRKANGTADGEIRISFTITRPPSEIPLRSFIPPMGESIMEVDPTGKNLVTLGKNGARVYRIGEEHPIYETPVLNGVITAEYRFSPDGTKLSILEELQNRPNTVFRVRTVDLSGSPVSTKEVISLPGPPRSHVLVKIPVWGVTPDSELIFIQMENTFQIYDSEAGRIIAEIPVGAEANALSFCPDGRQFVVGGMDGSVSLWDLPSALGISSAASRFVLLKQMKEADLALGYAAAQTIASMPEARKILEKELEAVDENPPPRITPEVISSILNAATAVRREGWNHPEYAFRQDHTRRVNELVEKSVEASDQSALDNIRKRLTEIAKIRDPEFFERATRAEGVLKYMNELASRRVFASNHGRYRKQLERALHLIPEK